MCGRAIVAPLVAALMLSPGTSLAQEAGEPRPGRVVRVVDEKGAPVAGAKVSLVTPARRIPLGGSDAGAWEALLEPPFGGCRVALDPPVTTDAEGRAVLPAPVPDPRGIPLPGCPVWACAPGFVPGFCDPRGAEGAPEEITLTLDRPVDLAGRLLDGRGAPVSGARVLAPYHYSWSEGPPPVLAPLSSITDSKGGFRIEGVYRGSMDLWIVLPSGVAFEMLPAWAPAPQGWDLRLGETGSLRCRFVDDETGKPLAGARYALQVDRPGGSGLALAAATGASAGDDGAAIVAPLPPGRVRWLGAEVEGYLPLPWTASDAEDEGPVVVAGSETPWVLRMKPGAVVRGRVSAGDGGPVPGALVQAVRWPPDRGGAGSGAESYFVAIAGKDGAFRFPGLPEGTFVLAVAAEGFQAVGGDPTDSRWKPPPSVLVEIKGRGPVERHLTVLRLGSVEGTVVNADGRPVPDAIVRLERGPRSEGTAMAGRTDGAGVFRFREVPPSAGWTAAAFRGTGATRSPARSAAFEVREGEAVSGVRIVLPAGGSVSGVLRRADGGPVEGLRIHLASGINAGAGLPAAARASVSGDPDPPKDPKAADPVFPRPAPDADLPGPYPVAADGSFRIGDLGTGAYTLVVDTGSPWWIRGPAVPLKEGEAKEGLEVGIPVLREVSLQATDEQGKPVAGAQAAITRRKERQWNRTEANLRTDAEGRARQGGLPPGPYTIEVSAPGYLRVAKTIDEASGDVAIVLPRGRSIAGIVVEAGTGAALGGVDIRLRLPDGVLPPVGGGRTVSGPDGRFSLEGLGEGAYDFLLEEREGGHAARLVRGIAAGTADVRVELVMALSVHGEILGPDGKPFHGAPPPVAWARPVGEGADVREGAERQAEWKGGFAILGLAPGEYEVGFTPAVMADFWCPEPVRVSAGAEGVVLRVAPLPCLAGRLVDPEGHPVAAGRTGAITIAPSDGSREPTGVMFPRSFTVTLGKDGAFESSPLDPGRTYDLRAGGFPGFEIAELKGIAPGTKDLALVLQARVVRSISGRVLDTEGRPVPAGRRVYAAAEGGTASGPVPWGEGTHVDTLTDAEGKFALQGLADLKFRVSAPSSYDGDDFRRLDQGSDVLVQAGAEGVVLRLFRFARVTGRLVDAGGRPIANTWVSALPAAPEARNYHGSAETAEDGTFLLRVAPGSFRLGMARNGREVDLGSFEAPVADLVVAGTVPPQASPLPPPPEEVLRAQKELPRLPEGVALSEDGRLHCGKDGSEMVLVPAGEFTMGTDGSVQDDVKPAHRVALSPFLIDRCEVTVGQYRKFCAATGMTLPGQVRNGSDEFPVANVDWNGARAYAAWAGRRLPTEAEWERAARGTDGRAYPWGDGDDEKRRNGSGPGDGFRGLAPVGSFPGGASPCGALDMAGNVWEWCADWYDPDHYRTAAAGSLDPRGPPSGTYRVLRGGSWKPSAPPLRADDRTWNAPTFRHALVGFRTALGIP